MITASVADNRELGYIVIEVTPPGGDPVDITFVRGVPTQLGDVSIADPFGDNQLSFTLPSVTIYDRPGRGDVSWLQPFSRVEAYWKIAPSAVGTDLEPILRSWRWCGFVASWDQNQDGSTSTTEVECIGALYILNNILAVPDVAPNPYPVESVIRMMVQRAVDVQLLPTPLVTRHHPGDYAIVQEYPAGSIFAPKDLVKGAKWSGVSTRSVGSLTAKAGEFVKSTLLPMLYTPGGRQYTLINEGWTPLLKVRPDLTYDETLKVDLVTPGVSFSFTQDYSNAPNSLYTTGKDVDGTPYNSLGRETPANYKVPKGANSGALTNRLSFNNAAPFATLPSILSETTVLNEASLSLSDGMSLSDALEVTRKKLLQNADPGYTGTLTLSSDPLLVVTRVNDQTKLRTEVSSQTYPRYCIRPGMIVEISGIASSSVLFHISQVSIDFTNGTVNLTVDSKKRDADTIEEMRSRTRDPLDSIRSVNTGLSKLNFPPDILLPWDNRVSGIIPFQTGITANMFAEINENKVPYPWTEVTTKYPPRRYENSYAKIPRANYIDSHRNCFVGNVRLASYADIRLLQIAAYDRNGNVLPVEYHVSFYSKTSVGPDVLPRVFVDPGKYGDKSITSSPWRQRTGHNQVPIRVHGYRQWSQVKKGKKSTQWFAYLIVDDYTPVLPLVAELYIQNVGAPVNSSAAASSTTAVTAVMQAPFGFAGKGDTPSQRMASFKRNVGIPSGFNMANKKLVWIVPRETAGSDFSLASNATATLVFSDYNPETKVYTRYVRSKGWAQYTNYPFFELAWTDRYPDGSYVDTVVGDGGNTKYTLGTGASLGFLNGWGTYYNPAGYWPATQVIKDVTEKTGLLQDESVWTVNLVQSSTKWDTRNLTRNRAIDKPGQVRVIIYCESPDQDVYFLGKLTHKPQGT